MLRVQQSFLVISPLLFYQPFLYFELASYLVIICQVDENFLIMATFLLQYLFHNNMHNILIQKFLQYQQSEYFIHNILLPLYYHSQPKHVNIGEMQSQEQQLLNFYSILFSKEQLRKNIYIFKSLNADMTIKVRVIAQQRHIAAITKNMEIIVNTLIKCQSVQVSQNHDTLKILIKGQLLIVALKSINKSKSVEEVKKLINPLIKDVTSIYYICQIKHQFRIITDAQKVATSLELQFQSEAAVSQFVARLKLKQDLKQNLEYEIKQKNPYQCIKQSIRQLKKQRKNQQQYQGQTTYGNYNNNMGYNNVSIIQNQKNYQPYINNYNNYSNYQGYEKIPYPGQYHVFIRKAVPSSEDEKYQSDKQDIPMTKQESNHANYSQSKKIKYETKGSTSKSQQKNKGNGNHAQKVKNSMKNIIDDHDQFPVL